MDTDDTRIANLLRTASDHLDPDVDRIVSVGIDRGRSRQRRARICMTVASLALIGAVGGLAAVLPLGASDQSSDVIATDVAMPTTEATPEDVLFRVPPTEFPATVAEVLGLSDVSPPLADVPEAVEDKGQIKAAHFLIDGMRVSVTVFSGEVADDTRAGDGTSGYEWSPSKGVLARGASFRRHGYVIVALAYNTATNPNPPATSPAHAAEPVLSEDQLLQVVTSDVWFESPQSAP